MSKTCFLPSVVLMLQLCLAAQLQGQATPQSQLREALEASSRIAALESEGAAPFHLKANFSTYDNNGKLAGEGTLEEFWLKPGTSRRIITLGAGTMTQVNLAGIPYLTITGIRDSLILHRVVDAIFAAVPSTRPLAVDNGLEGKMTQVGTATFQCIRIKSKSRVQHELDQALYCLEPDSHAVRLVQQYGYAIGFNDYASFGQHQVAKSITIRQSRLPRATAQITSLQAAPDLKETDFVPLSKAVKQSFDLVTLTKEDAKTMKLSRETPRYPQQDKDTHTSGVVTLHALIGVDGVVTDLEVLSAPSQSLADASTQVYATARFKPPLKDGTPCGAETIIETEYSFGG